MRSISIFWLVVSTASALPSDQTPPIRGGIRKGLRGLRESYENGDLLSNLIGNFADRGADRGADNDLRPSDFWGGQGLETDRRAGRRLGDAFRNLPKAAGEYGLESNVGKGLEGALFQGAFQGAIQGAVQGLTNALLNESPTVSAPRPYKSGFSGGSNSQLAPAPYPNNFDAYPQRPQEQYASRPQDPYSNNFGPYPPSPQGSYTLGPDAYSQNNQDNRSSRPSNYQQPRPENNRGSAGPGFEIEQGPRAYDHQGSQQSGQEAYSVFVPMLENNQGLQDNRQPLPSPSRAAWSPPKPTGRYAQ